MELLVDVFTKVGRTYNITLGGPDFHPSVIDFEREATAWPSISIRRNRAL